VTSRLSRLIAWGAKNSAHAPRNDGFAGRTEFWHPTRHSTPVRRWRAARDWRGASRQRWPLAGRIGSYRAPTDPARAVNKLQPRTESRRCAGRSNMCTPRGRSCLVAATHSRPAAQTARDRLEVVRKCALVEQFITANRGEPDRTRMHVQPNRYRRRLIHGRRPPYVALPGTPRQPTTMSKRRPTRQPIQAPRARRAAAPSCLTFDQSYTLHALVD
jgi:hypothetical protein